MNPNYKHFARAISMGPASDCALTIQLCMKLSGGSTDPNEITDWWNQWQMLKQAMKDNHPMIKLAAALAPIDPPIPSHTAAEAAARIALMKFPPKPTEQTNAVDHPQAPA